MKGSTAVSYITNGKTVTMNTSKIQVPAVTLVSNRDSTKPLTGSSTRNSSHMPQNQCNSK